MNKEDIEDLVFTLILGVMGTTGLALAALLIWSILDYPKAILIFCGVIIFFYGVGWCLKNYENFKRIFEVRGNEAIIPISRCGISTIDRLKRFEQKYNISTVEFMVFVHDNNIPYSMDNLDYLEWISLVNELPSISGNAKEENDNEKE